MRDLKTTRILIFAFGVCLSVSAATANDKDRDQLDREFQRIVTPFLHAYCIDCHGKEKPKAKFTLNPYTSLNSVTSDLGHWELMLRRLREKEMPPEEAQRIPDDAARQQIVDWIERVRNYEAERHRNDPGPAMARRLSKAEYDYAIHDLTGVDIQPARDFPVDPANEAGFANSGESLAMSPALLNKYLAAARHVASHLIFLPDGLEFAPHPVVIYSNRDKYCVHRIVNFYERQPTDYADYFYAAWRYQHRESLDISKTTLAQLAEEEDLSSKYLATIWALLTDEQNPSGPIAELRTAWQQLPAPTDNDLQSEIEIRKRCLEMRDGVIARRREYHAPVGDYRIKGMHLSAQPIILWKDRDIAANRRKGKLPEPDGTAETVQLREAIARFCSVFPDTFYVSERGRMFEKEGLDKALDPDKRSTGRLLSAGFHLMLGYFRDDQPLYDLILDEKQQRELDRMWIELEFVTQAATRQFSDYIYFERAEYPAYLNSAEFDFAREETGVHSQKKIERLARLYLKKARSRGIEDRVLKVIDEFFKETAANIGRLKKSLVDAEPSHRNEMLKFAERAWQRPLSPSDRDDLLGFYRVMRDDVGLTHEEAIRDSLVYVLMSPHFCYRVIESEPGDEPQPLSDYELASRLSFFLWSSLPDEELLAHAEAGDLHKPEVLIAQTRRMRADPRSRRLATEFGGQWLEFRRFQSHNAVNRDRFPTFTGELREAMFREPIYFIADLIQRDGSVWEFLKADHTFVNNSLADHYGIPFPESEPSQWIRIDNAKEYGRGGLLPMSVFLTMNAPGLRTSPVKRGYWVVRRMLGEHIPPPPPEVPELPEDESQLGDLTLRDALAKHREIKSCAQCHQRFDSIGLVFEGYGPIGERRVRDLGNRPVDTRAVFPDGSEGEGIEGLQRYLLDSRRDEFIDNLCRKLLSYALGRSLMLSDEFTVEAMKTRLEENDDRFGSLIETIVTSPQFLKKRGRDYDRNQTAQAAELENDGDAIDE